MYQIEYIETEKLIPYANNARTHDDNQVTQIASSIKEFGFNNPILIDDDNGIIAGHGRLMAAKKLGLKEVPTIKLSHLTDAQRKAYILADNRIALNSGWDAELLSLELQELSDVLDLTLLGFDDEEIKGIIDPINFEPATEDEQGKLDELEPKWIACPHCGKEFDARQS